MVHSKNLENSFSHFTNKSLIKSIVNKTLNDGILNYSESKNEFIHKSTKENLNTNLFAYHRILDYYDIGIIILLSTVSIYLKECQYNIFYNYISNYSCNHNSIQNNNMITKIVQKMIKNFKFLYRSSWNGLILKIFN